MRNLEKSPLLRQRVLKDYIAFQDFNGVFIANYFQRQTRQRMVMALQRRWQSAKH